MGEVLTTMKIMPDSPEVDLEAIKSTIESSMPEGAKIHEITEEITTEATKTSEFYIQSIHFQRLFDQRHPIDTNRLLSYHFLCNDKRNDYYSLLKIYRKLLPICNFSVNFMP